MRFGNKEIVTIYGQVGFSTVSDYRLIKDSQPLALGLDLINRLKPLEYIRIENLSNKKEWGIMVQDVKESLDTLKYISVFFYLQFRK